MWKSLFSNVRDALFPEKLPPLRLTSRPVQVREIWSHGNRKKATVGSLTLHAFFIGGIVALTIWGARTAAVIKPIEMANATPAMLWTWPFWPSVNCQMFHCDQGAGTIGSAVP